MPRHALVFLQPFWIAEIAVVGTVDPVDPQVAAPVVICLAVVQMFGGRILDDHPLVEPPGHVAGREVHLAHVDAVIARVVEILDPVAMIGPVVEAVSAGVVPVHARKDRRARGHTRRARTKGVAEGQPLPDQPILRRRGHIVVSPGADGVEALLVGHDQDDIGPGGHLFLLHPRFPERTQQEGHAEKQQTKPGGMHRHRAAIVWIVTPVLLADLMC